MRNCYDSLLSAAAATANSAYGVRIYSCFCELFLLFLLDFQLLFFSFSFLFFYVIRVPMSRYSKHAMFIFFSPKVC